MSRLKEAIIEHTITLKIPEKTYEVIEVQAETKGVKPAQIVMEWLYEAVKRAQTAEEDPLEALIGTLECKVTDVAERHDDSIGQALAKELQGRDARARYHRSPYHRPSFRASWIHASAQTLRLNGCHFHHQDAKTPRFPGHSSRPGVFVVNLPGPLRTSCQWITVVCVINRPAGSRTCTRRTIVQRE